MLSLQEFSTMSLFCHYIIYRDRIQTPSSEGIQPEYHISGIVTQNVFQIHTPCQDKLDKNFPKAHSHVYKVITNAMPLPPLPLPSLAESLPYIRSNILNTTHHTLQSATNNNDTRH